MENKNEKELKKLNNEDLEKTSGGYIYTKRPDFWYGSTKYKVIDDADGKVLGTYYSKREAKRMAKVKKQSTKDIGSSLNLHDYRDFVKK